MSATAHPPSAGPTSPVLRLAAVLVTVLAGALLLRAAVIWGLNAWGVITFPFQLDYGEGVVWGQAEAMLRGEGYAPLALYPHVVFHYPPLFHLAAELGGWLVRPLGGDTLAAGRGVSLLSALVAAACAGGVAMVAAGRATRLERNAAGAFAAALVLMPLPLLHFSGLFRVDLLALAFNAGGLLMVGIADGRTRRLTLAGLLFVAALFSKQNALAAPLAGLLVALFAWPRPTLAALAMALATGLAGLAALLAATDGTAIDHLVGYNLNPIEMERLRSLGLLLLREHALVGLALLALVLPRLARHPMDGPVTQRSRRTHLMMVAYLLAGALAMLQIVKSGSSWNYTLDFFLATAMLGGRTLGWIAAWAAGRQSTGVGRALAIVPIAFAVLVFETTLPPVDMERPRTPAVRAVNQQVYDAIVSTHGIVLSDDMLLLTKAGRPIPFEPAIMRDLVRGGRFDETVLLDLVKGRCFALVVDPARGFRFWTPNLAAALDQVYPEAQVIGHFRLRRPVDDAQPSASCPHA